jgi:hypothetical protein
MGNRNAWKHGARAAELAAIIQRIAGAHALLHGLNDTAGD